MEEPLLLHRHDPCRNLFDRTRVQNQSCVYHLDVVDFDVLSYWGQHRTWTSGESLRTVRCYVRYNKALKQSTIHSFPDQAYRIADCLTKDRGKYCSWVGNLFTAEELEAELRLAEQGITESVPGPHYTFQVERTAAGYLAHGAQHPLRARGKDLHQLREETYQKLDLHLAKTGGPHVRREQLQFVLR
ncbi:hypothetical protein [Hymenobacter cellulosivorans]|uniref:Uncharacterized protein n=1 Tax=Hymenobacter cellulosivorans TaxID=2932249 RepID=A0ABY4FAV0_9BACT|nr:hypothetical protein [Hymenobacter cellulosivorans]UOQ53054.1 hypothetical protein MUN80_25370 [Hymenobacter cellulosivorans]